MPLSAGTRLGPYEILEPLGAGGMGEVYRARDSRLKRDVALKVLPAELASEPERLQRFQREAETLAALNHPHIVTIFSVEEVEDLHFLTMELVEGKTLTRAIPRGGLPLSRFFQIAIPLTEAVSAAHEKGIVHRDLKPGNVMVTEEGRVKVLDFGLAKLREGVTGAADSQIPTEPATGPGRVLGTAPYMSPEQVQGKALDHRSDVFALGVMLYEMAIGERPFGGDTFAGVASSILKDTPASVTERKADLPRDLARLIRHCLEKEPRKRFQSTLDLANELEELRREVDSGEALTSGGAPAVTSRAGGKRRVWLVGVAVVAALALAVGSLLLSRNGQPPAAPVKITPFTSDGGFKKRPAISPDGEKVAYEWTGVEGGERDIYVKALGLGARPLRLTDHPARDRAPTWSPDGRQIAFMRQLEEGGAIYTVPSLGGQERKLVDVSGPVILDGAYIPPIPSWSPDGEWLAFAETSSEDEPARLVRLSVETLEKQPLSSPPDGTRGDFYPSYSPDGSLIAFVRVASAVLGDADVWVQPAEGGEARRLTFGEYDWCQTRTGGWTADGKEVLFTVTAPGFSIRRVSLAGGEPRPVEGVGQNTAWASIRGDRMVYGLLAPQSRDIWRVPGRNAANRDRPPERLIASAQDDNNPAFSPDGRKIAFSSNRSGVENIWICNSDGSDPVQLTSLERHAGTPRWSPDGRRLVFDSMEAGDWDVYVIDADGGVPRQLTQEPSTDTTGAWSPDGKWIYFHSDRSGESQIWRMPAEGGQAVPVTRNGCGSFPEVSWDGRSVYCWEGSVLWRVPVDAPERAEAILEQGDLWSWALGHSGIYFTSQDVIGRRKNRYTIHHLDFESSQVTELYRQEGPFDHQWLGVSPDEAWVLYAETPFPASELMLVENFR